MSNRINQRLEKIASGQKKNRESQAEMLAQMTEQKTDQPDFEAIAEELKERHIKEARSENFEHIKDTIYVQKDIYEAFNALCTKRGDKKKYTNQALAEFVAKKYKELQNDEK